jgi:hypothetical protein
MTSINIVIPQYQIAPVILRCRKVGLKAAIGGGLQASGSQ